MRSALGLFDLLGDKFEGGDDKTAEFGQLAVDTLIRYLAESAPEESPISR